MTTVMHIQLIIQVEHQTKNTIAIGLVRKSGTSTSHHHDSDWIITIIQWQLQDLIVTSIVFTIRIDGGKLENPAMNLSIIFLGKLWWEDLMKATSWWDQGCFKSQGKFGLLPFFRPIDSIDFSQFTTDPHES